MRFLNASSMPSHVLGAGKHKRTRNLSGSIWNLFCHIENASKIPKIKEQTFFLCEPLKPMLNTTEEFLKLTFLKGRGKKQVGLRFERGCGSHYAAFFREDSAFSAYELFIIKAESSWLHCGY